MADRLKHFHLVLLSLFGLLIMRLAQLQLIQGKRYARLSERNHIRRIILPAPRGRIYDCQGHLLADTRPSFTISVIPTELGDTSLLILSRLLDLSVEELRAHIEPFRFLSSPLTIRRNLDLKSVLRIEENHFRLSGVRISVDPIRSYPEPHAFCHVLGHLGEVTMVDLAKDTTYRLLDYIGRDGIEAQYEQLLRGKDGCEYLEVDARGREVGVLREKKPIPPVPGHDLRLTIDRDLQLRAAELTQSYERCAVVGLDVRTGAVLCLFSRPTYDPAIFLSPIPASLWSRLTTGSAKPFFNRAVSAAYPPGSVLKPIVALAALKQGIANRNTRLAPCAGGYKYGNRVFKCWSQHGSLDLLGAIAHSCNVYFYQLGLALGLDSLVSFCQKFPLGRITGIDLPSENTGNIPTRSWLDSRYGKGKWTTGMVLNFAIGQGEILATPLQLALTYAAIANDGIWPRPYIVAAIDSAGRLVDSTHTKLNRIPLDPHHTRTIRNALERVVAYGTATAAHLEEIAVAGKTGTAQNPGPDHAWFVGYAPADSARVVFAVLLENAGHGGAVAAPIVSELIRTWMQKQKHSTYFSADVDVNASANSSILVNKDETSP